MTRDENIRLKIEAISDLPDIERQLLAINDAIRQQNTLLGQLTTSTTGGSAAQVAAINAVTAALNAQQTASVAAAAAAATAGTAATTASTTATSAATAHSAATTAATAGYTSMGNAVRSFTGLIAGAFALNEIKQYGLDIIEAKTQIDSLKISLDVMLGSKKESAQLYNDIVKLAKTTPFTVGEVGEQAAKLLAYNIATADLIPTITALGNIAAAVGKDKLPQLTLAYGQVATSGRLMLTELRQFSEAGVPLISLIATAYGKTEAEVRKMADAHEISFAMVRKAIMAASEEGGKYAALMALQAKTVGGEVSNLSDTYLFAKARVGDFYENTIKNGTATIANFTNATLGSNSAIQRTVDVVKAAAAGLATLTLITKAQAAADALLTAYQATKNVLYGEYLILQRALTGSTVALTVAQLDAVAAAEAFNAALASNPVGLFIAAVGALVAVFYTYKAVNDEVTASMGEQEYQIRTEQAELNRLAEAALGAAEGSKRRKEWIDLLISKYPEYFSGLNSETVSNAQLQSILNKVNGSYQERIALAKETYNVEKLNDQRRKLWDEEEQAIGRLVARSPELAKYGKDAGKVLDYLKSDYNTWIKTLAGDGLEDKADNLFFGNPVKQLEKVRTGLATIETELSGSDERIKAARGKSQNAHVEEIKAHYAVLRTDAAGHGDQIAQINAAEKIAISKANGTYREAEVKAVFDHAEKTKSVTLLSSKEQQALLKGAIAETYQEKLKALEAEKDAALEAANKAVVNTKISHAALEQLKRESEQRQLQIQAHYAEERAAITLKYETEERDNFSRSLETNITLIQARIEKQREADGQELITSFTRTEGYKEIAKQAKEAEKQIQESRKETEKIEAETAKLSAERRAKTIDGLAQMATQFGGLTGQVAAFTLKAIGDIDLLSGKANKAAEDRVTEAKFNLDLVQKMFDANDTVGAAKIAKAKKDFADADANLENTKIKGVEAVFSVIGTGYTLLTTFAETINNALKAAAAARNQAIADALRDTTESLTELNNFVRNANKESLDLILSDTALSLEQRQQAITKYYTEEREMAANQQRIQVELDFLTAVYQAKVDADGDVKKFMEGVAAADKVRSESAKQFEIDKLLSLRDENIRIATEIRDDKIRLLKDELDAFKAAKEAETDALNQELARRKALENQNSSDDQLRLQEDAIFRQQLLDQGEAREIASLEAAKQRELTRAQESGASAEEVARIITAFDKLIADKHTEYEDAKGNKSKEISLATEEAKAKESAAVSALEAKTTGEINALKDQVAAKDAEVNFRMKMANNEYQESKRRAEYESFESQKALLIAQVQAEIAILRGRRVPANIINDLIAALNQVSGAQNPFVEDSQTGVNTIAQAQANVDAIKASQTPSQIVDNKIIPTTTAFTKDGKRMELTYNPSGKGVDAYDQNANRIFIYFADGYVPETGQRFFKGTDYLRLGKNPAGRDTIPIWANEGERILPTADNKAIGGRDLTNDKLVEKVRGYDLFVAQYPQMVMPQNTGGILRLPDGIMNSQGGQSIDLSELTDAFKSMEQTFKQKKLVSIQMDKNGFSTALIGQQSKITYYDNLFQR